ncbi:MFS domain-containing protein [Kluyveromyces marxianus]
MLSYNKYKDDPNVLGTTVIDSKVPNLSQELGLKKRDGIILNPTPTSHPDDPLNWSTPRKLLHNYMLFFYCLILAAAPTWMGPIYMLLKVDLKVTLHQLNRANALVFFFLAVSCLLVQPLANSWGRRPVYLISTFLTVIGMVIIGATATYGGLLASCIILGFAVGPIDSLVEVSITDIFFLHEHGRYMGIYILATSMGSCFGPFISGYVAQDLPTWRWSPYIVIIVGSTLLVVHFFFLEESIFDRDLYIDEEANHKKMLTVAVSNVSQVKGDVNIDGNLPALDEAMTSKHEERIEQSLADSADSLTTEQEEAIDQTIKKKTFYQKMYFLSSQSKSLSIIELIQGCFSSLRAVRLPAVFLGAVIYGIQIWWLSLQQTATSVLYAGPPYLFKPNELSNLSLAGVVGSFLAVIYNMFSDPVQLYFCKREGSNGLFEPEYRLIMNFIPTILNALGILLFGYAPLYKLHWFAGACGICFINFGMSAIISNTLAYVLESYPGKNMAVTSMSSILFYRNVVGGVFTLVFQYWYDAQGAKGIIGTLGGLCIALNSLVIVFWFYGKSLRKYAQEKYHLTV